ncbi:Na+/H+ antiporter [Mangrovactinospora gilvigrisea]|uniref:Na+/H+ antiporter n=1 Tax=Mangrovactinospora gilvigrisea TaxID=1428644 RepID=A0A1J7BY13_9ACTN|nr:Na+/H+ antiporter [Mangrovactinospora gilvigrisea]OIV38369.1 Na+/H+ antiporter [Mangrovactinospora gilvigrisea]
MDQLTLLFIVLFATIIVVPLARRIGLPFPVLLTVLGIVLAVLNFVPNVEIEPELILPVVLPPLLYASAQRSSWRQFAANRRPILLLAVALVVVTTVVVAYVGSALVPGLTLASAFVLGAMIAPPDPVAASAVAGSLGLPRRMVSILEGEGLFNDVTAIVIYGVAVDAVVTGKFSAWHAALQLVLSAVLAIAIGYAIGWVANRLLTVMNDSTLQIGLTLIVPTFSYVIAEELHGSAVLAVLVTSLYLTGRAYGPDDSETRLQASAFWEVVELLVTGGAFTLIGLELHNVVRGVSHTWTSLLWPALAVAGVVIAVRLLWLLPMTWFSHRLAARHRRKPGEERGEQPTGWRETVVMWWAGMRGVATIALALGVPLTVDGGKDFPGRPQILFVAFVVVLVTLVLQGLSLPGLVKALRVRDAGEDEERQEKLLAKRAAKASLRRLKEIEGVEDLPDEVVERLRRRHADLLARLSPDAYDEEQKAALKERTKRLVRMREIESEMSSAARAAVLSARSEPGMDPEVVDRVLRRLDLRAMH